MTFSMKNMSKDEKDFHDFLMFHGFMEIENENSITYLKTVSIFENKNLKHIEVNHNLNFTMIIEVKEDSLGVIYELNASIDSGIMKTVPMFKKIGRDWKETIMYSQLILNKISGRMNFSSI